MKVTKIEKNGLAGLKIKLGKGKAKRTIKIPVVEAIIIGVGLVEGYLIGGFTGALLGVAFGGLAILSCLLCALPFVGLLLYHWVMTFAFSIAQVNMKTVYLVGFIYGLYVTWQVLEEIFKILEKRGKQKIKESKIISYKIKQK